MINAAMTPDAGIDDFLVQYPERVCLLAQQLREVVKDSLPDIIEQLDLPARMVGYAYGQKYKEMVCTIIPSQKGLKLGFPYGPGLPDSEGWLEGNGKLSRYVVIKGEAQIHSPVLRQLLSDAMAAYRERMTGS